MKKSTSLLLSGILVSGMVLGTVVTPATVVNATTPAKTSDEVTKVTNLVKFVDGNGDAIKGLSSQSYNQTIGSTIALPSGYSLYPGVDQKAVMLADGTTQTLKVAPSDKVTTVSVNYIDESNNEQVGYTTVTGIIGEKANVPAPSNSDYVLSNGNATITVQKDRTYSIDVTKNVVNTVIFKTADGNTQVGTATVTGKKVGDVVDVTSKLPAGYTSDNAKVTLQYSGNTQIVTVKKAADGITPFKSVVTTNSDTAFTQLYTVKGGKATRALVAGTDWQTNNQMTLDGVKYYQVSTTEWVKADDVAIKSTDNDNTNTDNTDVQKADRTKVTTKNIAITNLYTQDGDVVASRGLGRNSSWLTDKMVTTNGVKMYRVATNEWIRASDIL